MIVAYTYIKILFNGTFTVSHTQSTCNCSLCKRSVIHLVAQKYQTTSRGYLSWKVLGIILLFILMNMLINAKSSYHDNYLQIGERLLKRRLYSKIKLLMDLSNEVTFKSTNKVSIDDHNFVIANYIDNSTSNLHDIISNDGQWSFVVVCVCDDKLQCSSNLTIPGRSCMAHQQMLATTAAKIIHTAVQVWLALCYILVIVMCRYGSI
jgi:hypothetical protein